jgi:hemerythrin
MVYQVASRSRSLLVSSCFKLKNGLSKSFLLSDRFLALNSGNSRSFSRSCLLRSSPSGLLLLQRSCQGLVTGLQTEWNSTRQLPGERISNQKLNFSTNESSFSPINWWRGRQEKKEAEKYVKRVREMSEMEVFTVGHMLSEIDEAAKSWSAKLINNKESQIVKQMHKSLSGIVSIVGEGAASDRLNNMSRKEKLEAAIAGETTVEEINILAKQFQTMSLMHLVLRKRKLEGRQIPETAEAMQAVIQSEGHKVLSKDQRKKLGMQQAKMMMRKRG